MPIHFPVETGDQEPLITCHLAALKTTFSGAQHAPGQRKQIPYRVPGLVSHAVGHRKSPGELPVAQKPHKVRGVGHQGGMWVGKFPQVILMYNLVWVSAWQGL